MNNQTQSKKDIWDKTDVLLKGILGVAITGVIAFYGIMSNQRELEKSRQVATQLARADAGKLVVQTMNHRETSAAEMRAQMFNTLMQHYFQEKDQERTRIIILELLALNFQDQIYLKPLFEDLDRQLKVEKKQGERELLRKAARRITKSEIDNIEGAGGRVDKYTLGIDQTIYPAGNPIAMTLLGIEEDQVTISLDDDDKEGFGVNYFDMPFTDNTTKGQWTYSVVLSNITKDSAILKIVTFPSNYFGSGNNLLFDALVGDLLSQQFSQLQDLTEEVTESQTATPVKISSNASE